MAKKVRVPFSWNPQFPRTTQHSWQLGRVILDGKAPKDWDTLSGAMTEANTFDPARVVVDLGYFDPRGREVREAHGRKQT